MPSIQQANVQSGQQYNAGNIGLASGGIGEIRQPNLQVKADTLATDVNNLLDTSLKAYSTTQKMDYEANIKAVSSYATQQYVDYVERISALDSDETLSPHDKKIQIEKIHQEGIVNATKGINLDYQDSVDTLDQTYTKKAKLLAIEKTKEYDAQILKEDILSQDNSIKSSLQTIGINKGTGISYKEFESYYKSTPMLSKLYTDKQLSDMYVEYGMIKKENEYAKDITKFQQYKNIDTFTSTIEGYDQLSEETKNGIIEKHTKATKAYNSYISDITDKFKDEILTKAELFHTDNKKLSILEAQVKSQLSTDMDKGKLVQALSHIRIFKESNTAKAEARQAKLDAANKQRLEDFKDYQMYKVDQSAKTGSGILEIGKDGKFGVSTDFTASIKSTANIIKATYRDRPDKMKIELAKLDDKVQNAFKVNVEVQTQNLYKPDARGMSNEGQAINKQRRTIEVGNAINEGLRKRDLGLNGIGDWKKASNLISANGSLPEGFANNMGNLLNSPDQKQRALGLTILSNLAERNGNTKSMIMGNESLGKLYTYATTMNRITGGKATQLDLNIGQGIASKTIDMTSIIDQSRRIVTRIDNFDNEEDKRKQMETAQYYLARGVGYDDVKSLVEDDRANNWTKSSKQSVIMKYAPTWATETVVDKTAEILRYSNKNVANSQFTMQGNVDDGIDVYINVKGEDVLYTTLTKDTHYKMVGLYEKSGRDADYNEYKKRKADQIKNRTELNKRRTNKDNVGYITENMMFGL